MGENIACLLPLRFITEWDCRNLSLNCWAGHYVNMYGFPMVMDTWLPLCVHGIRKNGGTMIRRTVVCFGVLLVLAGTAWGDFQTAVEAYKNGQHERALREFKLLADQGSAEAQFNLGIMYFRGEGVAQNHAEAIMWFRRAAAQDDPDAQFNLGVAYAEGQGVSRDYPEALNWYRKAADRNHDSAQFNIGLLYYQGKGVPQDYAEALKWYRRAAEQGNARAQYNLGMMYAKGQAVPVDLVQAYKWLTLGGEKGIQDAAALRAEVAATMTPDQMAGAQDLLRIWRETTGKQ
jgi:TPR repeat protein